MRYTICTDRHDVCLAVIGRKAAISFRWHLPKYADSDSIFDNKVSKRSISQNCFMFIHFMALDFTFTGKWFENKGETLLS